MQESEVFVAMHVFAAMSHMSNGWMTNTVTFEAPEFVRNSENNLAAMQ